MRLLNLLRGSISIVLYLLSLIFFGLLTIIIALPWFIPSQTWRRFYIKFIVLAPIWWMDFNRLITHISTHGKWDVESNNQLDPHGWYLMISNHSSWLDILVLGCAFNRKIPILKFFLKKELLWSLPVAGLACYVLGYPFLERHTAADIRKNPALKGKDIENTKKACEKLKLTPSAIINFVEGTRFSETKRIKQQSPYQHLLKPKAGGVAIVLNEMHTYLKGIINVTIHYTPRNLTLWNFACGNLKKIIVRYEVLPITPDILGNYYDDRKFRAHFQKWMNDKWTEKDRQIDDLIHERNS